MRPLQFNTKREMNPNEMYTSHLLKINRDSHFIRKPFSPSPSSPPPSSSAASSSASSVSISVSAPNLATKPPPRQPLIIYTRPPKVIHTNPNDFMALVQKLTGLSRPDGNPNPNPNPNPSPKKEPNEGAHGPKDLNKEFPKAAFSDESDSSVVSEESCPSTILEDVHVNSCFPPIPIFDPNMNHYFNNIPMLTPNDYLCSANPFFSNYADPLLLMPNRTSTNSNNLEALKELHEF